jgi:hypothetical protein
MTSDPIEMAAVYHNQAKDKYYEWVRSMLTLATAALAGLIAFQDNYVPSDPNALYLLWASWVSLASSILAAAFILRSDGVYMKLLANKTAGQHQNRVTVVGGPLRYDLAAWAFPWLLAISLVLLCAFAIYNSAGPCRTIRMFTS